MTRSTATAKRLRLAQRFKPTIARVCRGDENEQGLVRHIGVSNFDVERLRRIQQIAPVETLQPQYSLIERAVEARLLPYAESEGIGVIAYSPMASGLLTGRMTRQRIAAAIAWTLRDPAVGGAIVGFRSAEQVDPLLEAAGLELPSEDISTIEGDR